jgi:microcompartment protein CcmK/EutM
VRTGRVVGEVVATEKHPALEGWKLLLVALDSSGSTGKAEETIALDAAGAGVGDRVLIHDEGAGAAQVMGTGRGPVRTMIVGVIDHVTIEEES